MKNLREADESLKRFIQEDVKALTDELSETETLLQKLEGSRQSQMYAVRDIEKIKERLLSFEKYAKDAQPDVLVTLIQSFVERIYIVDENDERYCHIFIKGCTKEDYDEFFRATGYISGTRENGNITSKLPLCDSDECCKSKRNGCNITVESFDRKSIAKYFLQIPFLFCGVFWFGCAVAARKIVIYVGFLCILSYCVDKKAMHTI